MATFLIETSVDYSDQQIAEVDAVRFLDFTGIGTVTATFHLSQFTNSEPIPPPPIVITGGNGRNHLVLNVEDREGFENFRFLASNLQFANWTSKDRVTIYGGETGEEIRGTRVNDRIYGGAGDDEIRSNDGRDTVYGGSGNDTLSMFSGKDQIFGGSGIDTVQLSVSGSQVSIDMATGSGAVGDQSFSGCEVLDISFFSGSGTVAGADGNDTVAVYSEDSVIFSGGAGDDKFFVSTAELPPTGSFDGGDGVDTIDVNEVAYENRASVGAVSADISDGGGGRDIGWGLLISGVEVLRFSAGDLADYLRGGAMADYLNGEGGNDTLVGGMGADTLVGFDGVDTLDYQFGFAGVSVNLQTGAASGGEASGDVISGFENVTGGSGNDTLTGSTGANRILGGSGNDRVAGGGGSDVLDGSDGDDTLTGGAAGDTLTGGRGADVFVFALASDSGVLKSDRITDLSTRSDVIDLSAIGIGFRGDTITFSFIGIDGFVRGAGAQLRYEVASGTTSILGDTDGDGSADLRILLTGNVTLTEDVFIL